MSRYLFLAILAVLHFGLASALGPRTIDDVFTGAWRNIVATNRNSHSAPSATILQRVDHFDEANNQTFQQRYFYNGRYYRVGRPLYVILNYQDLADPFNMELTLIDSIALSEFGYVFLLESRFYGQSIPNTDLSLENLRYLNVEQSLADVAHFVNHIRTTTPGAENSPVVVAGRGYGGSLAVWFRQKYPHLTVGAWASSAPLVALQNNQQYKEYAGDAIRKVGGVQCYNVIDEGFKDLEAMALDGNLTELDQLMNVCPQHHLESHNDVVTLFVFMSEFFTAIAESLYVIPHTCNLLLDNHSTPAKAIASMFEDFFQGICIRANYEDLIRRLKVVYEGDVTEYTAMRQVQYQKCTQLGWHSTSESVNQPFGSFYPLAFFTEICTRVFGEEVAQHAVAQANQDRFNSEHNGLNPHITNAVITFGTADSSQSLGVRNHLGEISVHVIRIEEAGQSEDFGAISWLDRPNMTEVKLDIMQIIRSWTN